MPAATFTSANRARVFVLQGVDPSAPLLQYARAYLPGVKTGHHADGRYGSNSEVDLADADFRFNPQSRRALRPYIFYPLKTALQPGALRGRLWGRLLRARAVAPV